MLLAEYGSDSDSGSDNEAGSSKPTIPAVKATPAPAPSASSSSSKVKRKAPVKITLDLPKSSTSGSGSRGDDDDEGRVSDHDDERDSKKAKTAGGSGPKGGKGSSSLLGMLPPPKRKTPAAKPGAGQTVTKSIAKPTIAVPKPAANLPAPPGHIGADDSDDEDEPPARAGMLLPPSVQRGQAKTKAKGKEPALDLFGLASDAGPSTSTPKAKVPAPPSMSISSAPAVADFVPPEPTPNDPYPGYYQLPSGDWAAYDPEYYHSFFPNTTTEEDDDDGRVGRHWEEFNSKGADFIDIDVGKGLEEARAEKERREKMVKPKLPSDEVEYKAVGQIKGLATERHQLSSLLNTAFTQKEELENRIASNKKNMRVAAQKYGF